LHYIGPVARERLVRVTSGLAVPFDPIELLLDRAEVWPNGAAVLVPTQDDAALTALHAALGDAIDQLALAREARPFRPHVTLARRARGTRLVQGRPFNWRARSYALLESAQGYRVLCRFG
jgi:RNA 2',3'-cyclic 3'-phosphodiesterase